ncbi:MAG: polysaccharide pyruvyl transferase family protein [Candidatus Contendobacter sp.]|nr:polysaccharide pyruvyl transferase family protein [Candidatus Contendobacter sp.]MDG4558125.1 polysaccharide pyruvyl transferase family protein [Candidatus Contendobacter sp.]
MDIYARQFCASDMENFGDVLYPILLDRIVARRYPESRIGKYAFIAGDAPLDANYSNTDIRSLFGGDIKPMPLIIGGGDIIRTDDLTVAGHYRSYYPNLIKRQKERTKPVLVGTSGTMTFTVHYYYTPTPELINEIWFKKELMPPCEFSFMLSSETCPAASKVAFFSVGVPFEIDPKYHDLVKSTFDKAACIYVRDGQSREKLLKVGVANDIIVAPDMAILVSDLFPKTELDNLKSEALSSIGFRGDERYFCYQMSQAGVDNIHQVARVLSVITKKYGLKTVLLPLGLCHGDLAVLQAISSFVPDVARVLKTNNMWHMLAVIAHSALFAGVSLHGNLVAYSYDVPYLFTPLDVDKITGAMDILEIPPQCRLKNWEELQSSISSLLESGETIINRSGRIESMKKTMAAVYALLDSISQPSLGVA